MNTQVVNIDAVADVTADEGLYPASNGYRNPASPGFIFFDDDRELSDVDHYARATALDFEEWKARKEHQEALDSRQEAPARQVIIRTAAKAPVPLVAAKNPTKVVKAPTKREIKRASYLRALPGSQGMMRISQTKRIPTEIPLPVDTASLIHEDDFIEPDLPKPYKLVQDDYHAMARAVWSVFPTEEIHPGVVVQKVGKWLTPEQRERLRPLLQELANRPIKDHVEIDYNESMEAAQTRLWHTGFRRRQGKESNNDNWRKLVMPLMEHLDEPDVIAIVKGVRDALPFAPGPVNATVYRNPDGSRHVVGAKNPAAAKAGFIRQHKIESDLVTMDRVQYEGEKFSRYVIGVRKSSAETPSNYYDPSAELMEGERYVPQASILRCVPANKIFRGYRLTVRELEQALIAGASFHENEVDEIANQLETIDDVDDRTLLMNQGYGDDGRTAAALDEEEQYLHSLLLGFGHELAAELILLRNQEKDVLFNYFHSGSKGLNPDVFDIIDYVKGDDEIRLDQARASGTASSFTPMLLFVKKALVGH